VTSDSSEGQASRLTGWLLVLLVLAACSSTPERPATYTVKRGDTLYAIAWRHGLEYRDLARWNRIGRDYVIHPGQKLRLYPPSRGAPRASPQKSAPAAAAKQPMRPPRGPPVQWQWPVSGGAATVTSRPNGGHGLTIAGRLGDDVRAAGPGRVVYTGSGLLGYGQLVIIKHNDTYLSAYGHTQSVAIKEGDVVAAGQRIATMGAGPRGAPMLYFEIRVNGAPTNPLGLLPSR
jgi:lipoprotein NlpD